MMSKVSLLFVVLLFLFPIGNVSAENSPHDIELDKEFIILQNEALDQYVLEASMYGSFNYVDVIPTYIGGQRKDLELIRNDENRVLFSLKGILQEFDASVTQESGDWVIKADDTVLVIGRDATKAKVNGESIQLDTSLYQSENDIYVPIKLLIDVFHLDVYWSEVERAIYINKKEFQQNESELPISMTSIQVGNYLLDGFAVGDTKYGFLNELLEALGAKTMSGCTEFVIEYKEQEYMIDLVSGTVNVNGEINQISSTPYFIGSELVIPLEWLTEVLDIKVDYIEEHNTVLVLPYYE